MHQHNPHFSTNQLRSVRAPADVYKGLAGGLFRSVSNAPRKITAVTYRDLMARNFPDREWVMEPWLRQGESVMIWAASGVGKTMLTLTLAIAMAGGGSFAGWAAGRPRKVLLVDGEMHVQDLQERLKTLTRAVSGIDHDALADNLKIIARQGQAPDSGPFYDISCPNGQAQLLRRVDQEEAEVVFLDNYTTLSDSLADENDAVAFKPIMGLLLGFKQRNVSVMLVHHASKGGQAYRGSTALETTFEVIIGLKRPDDARPGNAHFRLEFGKFRQKGGASTQSRVFALADDHWIVSEDEDDTLTRILGALRSCRYGSQKEIAVALAIDPATVSRQLKRAVLDGCVTRRGIKEALGEATSGDPPGPEDDF